MNLARLYPQEYAANSREFQLASRALELGHITIMVCLHTYCLYGEYWVQVQDPLLIVHQGAFNQREDVEVFGHSNVLNAFTILVNWIDDDGEGVPLLLTTASAGAA